ncbi:MAG: endonuclease Q family protein, partial [Candidatus Methanomethyliaceae archaeon]|nr:endonuclease Q family protein [Candidatus Methanomethyliaceae archaeon]
IRLLPLNDLIAASIDRYPFSNDVQKAYWEIVGKIGSEFKVLLEAPKEELERVCSKEIVELILMNRENKISIIPGYDGVYGKIKLFGIEFKRPKTLEDYMEGENDA